MSSRLLEFIKSLLSQMIVASKKVNRIAITLISIAITAMVLGYLVYRQREIILNYQWQFRPVQILLAFLVYSIALFWVSITWGWIVNHLGSKLNYQKHIRYYIVSNLAKRIPGTIWYVASRLQLYATDGLDAKTTAIASGIEMVFITLAGILVALLFSTQTVIQYQISPILLILIFVLGLSTLHPKVVRWILLRRNVEIRALNYTFIIQGIFSYVLSWILGGIVLFLTSNIITTVSVGNLPYLIACWALVGIVSTLLFFSPSNLGITEIGLSLLLSEIVPSSIAVLIAVSSRILMIAFEIIWACIFLWVKLPGTNPLTQKD